MKNIILALLLLMPAHGFGKYSILVSEGGQDKANLAYEWRDTIWTTINRYFDEYKYLYQPADEFHFKITPTNGEPVWYMHGCYTSGRLIISANDPLYCRPEFLPHELAAITPTASSLDTRIRSVDSPTVNSRNMLLREKERTQVFGCCWCLQGNYLKRLHHTETACCCITPPCHQPFH